MKKIKMNLNLYNLFYIFILASIFGWFLEGLWTLYRKGVIINHSAVVIGPFNFIYGICAVMLTTFLFKAKDSSYLKLFLIGFIGGTILEYLMSLGMEWVLGFSAWDYSKKFLNINGRVCLVYSIFWGILGIIWIKFLYPRIQKLINSMDLKIGRRLMILISIFLVFDLFLTTSAVIRAKSADDGIPPQNKYEEFLDIAFDSAYLKNMFNNNWVKK